MICWKCKKEINVEQIFRSTECPLCHADLHCCKACKFYSINSHFDCKENIEAPVSDKEKSNFCDFYSPDLTESKVENSKKADALSDFNALFGDSSVKAEEKSSKDAFNSLFGD